MKDYSHWKRITKYNPCYRNEQGAYMRPEWTSISDIGSVFGGNLFTQEEYIQVEAAYVRAAYLLLAETTNITLMNLEWYSTGPNQLLEPALYQTWQTLQEGATIAVWEVGPVVQLILREHLWCYIVDSNLQVKLRFGYDYYMYVNYEKIPSETFTAVEALSLFVD